MNFISPWRQQTQNTQTYKAKQEKRKKKKHTCNYKHKKEKSKETQLQAKSLKRRGEHSPVMIYFVNNICKSCLPNRPTPKRMFMIELLHDSILYKKTNSTSIDLRNQWEIAHKTLNIIDTINIISSKQFPENSMPTVT